MDKIRDELVKIREGNIQLKRESKMTEGNVIELEEKVEYLG